VIKDYYNPLAEKRYVFVLQQVRDYAKGKKLYILDVGCGLGRLSFPLAEVGHNIVGIDEDAELIKQCNKLNKYPNATFLCMDAHALRNVAKFDVVILCEVLEHTLFPFKIVRNIEDVLKPSGILLFLATNGYCPSEVMLHRLLGKNGKSNRALKIISRIYCFVTNTKMTRTHPFYLDDLHVQFFSLRGIKKLFVNFKIETIENSDLGLFIPGAGRMAKLKRIECKIADHLPHFMVGGWMMVLKRWI
jgi:SAM-dependent methyltransferase